MSLPKPEMNPEAQARVQELAARTLVEQSFLYFIEWVVIQGERGPTPFLLYDYQREIAADWEQAFFAGQQLGFVELKARQLGFSWLAAAFAYWCAAYHEASDVAVFSMGEREVQQQFRRMHYIHHRLPPFIQPVKADLKLTAIEFEGGSMIKGFPATKLAGESFTFRVVLMDEIAKHDYGAENWAAVSPTLQENGMYVLFSTANPELGPNGFMYDTYFPAKRGEIPGMKARFTPWYVRPPRFRLVDGKKEPNWAWRDQATKRMKGTPEAVGAYYPTLDHEAFVGKSGLVFPSGAPIGRAPGRWEEYRWRVAGVDFGGGDPTAIVPVGITAGQRFHQPGEFYRRRPVGIDEIYAYLARLHQIAPFDFVVCDRAGNQTIIETLVGMGLPAVPFGMGVKGGSGRNSSLDIMRMLHEQKLLTIGPECVESIHEYDGYRWTKRKDPNSKAEYMTSTPVDHHADGHDARRYACVTAWRALPQKELEAPNVVGQRRSGVVFV